MTRLNANLITVPKQAESNAIGVLFVPVIVVRLKGNTRCFFLSFLSRLDLIIIIDRFYIALFSALEQTHCARMWFYMSE